MKTQMTDTKPIRPARLSCKESLETTGTAQILRARPLGKRVSLIANPRLEPRLSLRKQTTQKFLIANFRGFLFCRFSSNFQSIFSALSSRMPSETGATNVLYSVRGIR